MATMNQDTPMMAHYSYGGLLLVTNPIGQPVAVQLSGSNVEDTRWLQLPAFSYVVLTDIVGELTTVQFFTWDCPWGEIKTATVSQLNPADPKKLKMHQLEAELTEWGPAMQIVQTLDVD